MSDRNTTNGNATHSSEHLPSYPPKRTDTFNSMQSAKSSEATYLAPTRVGALLRKDSNLSQHSSAQDSLLDLYGSNTPNRSELNSMDHGVRKPGDTGSYANDEDPESSRWIHRDKLAQIESQELQAAGIVLPRARAPSKSSRRDRSRDHNINGLARSEQSGQGQKRQRIGSLPAEAADEMDENDVRSWDLRQPEEVAKDAQNGFTEYGSAHKGVSRIPVFKTSPLPIPLDYLERDAPAIRNRSNGHSIDDDGLGYHKPRSRGAGDETATPTPAKRAQSETSPSKKTTNTGPRKGSTTTRATSAQGGRPTTRAGKRDTPSSRPPTRSGDLNTVKAPEGDPPWLASMYKPDPRLPPDQQLLPTVAKRLQQEQWEKEGKFGNAYDRDFRPLNDEEFSQRPESSSAPLAPELPKPEEGAEWPLKPAKSPSPAGGRPGTSGGYSTIPKVRDVVPPSPMTPRAPVGVPQPLRVQEPPEEKKEKGGCAGCCVVM
jgi:hypothetical protein